MRLAARAAVASAIVLASLPGRAGADDSPPSAERLRSAASEYDAGRRAFGEKDYENAATHFENAFHDAANASAIRSAIRARKKANQLARAATLANLAEGRYAKDAATMSVVHEVLKDAHGKLDRITLRCTPDCGVAVDGRAIANEDARETVFYLDPGEHALVVSWSSDRNRSSTITATAGGEDALSFEAPPMPVAAAPAVAALASPEAVAPAQAATKPLAPVFFYSGAAATAIALAVTVWSGVDAENNPGTAAVRRDCVGQGTSCPEYKEGLNGQLRTNVLIGTTAVLGAGTAAVGIFFTRWSGAKPESRPPPVTASFRPLPGGGAFSLSGRF